MTPDTVALIPQAQTLVRHNLQAKPGEHILLVWDGTVSRPLLDACQAVLAADRIRADTLIYQPLARRARREYCYFAGASLRPDETQIPPILHAAIEASDAVVLLCSDMDLMMAPGWKGLLDQAGSDKVPRMLFLPYLTTEDTLRMLPTSEEEVTTQHNLVKAVGDTFEAREAHITSEAGTDLHMTLGQWSTRLHFGIAPPGGLQVLPAGQITRVPDDESAEGTLVIDRSIADNDYKALTEPVTLHITAGNVTRIEGGAEARRFERFLASFDDPRIYHVTELGVGTNPRCYFDGIGGPAEDTHTWGTVSMAVGCDTHIGGGVPGPAHIDMTMRYPTLTLDGREVVRSGKLQIEAA